MGKKKSVKKRRREGLQEQTERIAKKLVTAADLAPRSHTSAGSGSDSGADSAEEGEEVLHLFKPTFFSTINIII
jgi:hypothetical protein